MIKSIVATGSVAAFTAALLFAVPTATAATSQADCVKMWSQVAKKGDKAVSLKNAQTAWASKANAVKAADTNKDSQLSAAEFLTACQKGAFGK